MRRTVLVLCQVCKGTGDNPDEPHLQCGWCNKGHEAVDRTPDGEIPAGRVEWIPPTLPEFSHIPRCC